MQADIDDILAPKAPTRRSYPGGKNGMGVYQNIINNMPPHDVYIEPFVGGGAILKRKRPAESNIVIDSDAEAIVALQGYCEVNSVRYMIGDGVQFLRDTKLNSRVLVYADPPYVRSTRSCQRDLYKHEWTDSDHEAFLELITSLPCMVMVSGYDSELYGRKLAGWHKITFTGMTHRGQKRTECVWMNFPPPTALHDYRYLGDGFRERERIKRKSKRWAKKVAEMNELERQAVLSACRQFVE